MKNKVLFISCFFPFKYDYETWIHDDLQALSKHLDILLVSKIYGTTSSINKSYSNPKYSILDIAN